MSIVAVVGPTSSTTALALASTWPPAHLGESGADGGTDGSTDRSIDRGENGSIDRGENGSADGGTDATLLVEADPAGGVYSAWLDLPSSPGLASAVAAPSGTSVAEHAQRSRGGLQVIVGPVRPREAARAAHEAVHRVLSPWARRRAVLVVDGGRRPAVDGGGLLALAQLVVVCVHQRAGSATAVAADLERTAELCDALAARATRVVLAIVGDRPFAGAEIAAHLGGDAGTLPWCALADDPWSAGVLAGRIGSPRRMRRSPLLLSATAASRQLAHLLTTADAAATGAAGGPAGGGWS